MSLDGADPEDPYTPRRTARTSAAFTCARPNHQRGRVRAGQRRRQRLPGVARRATRDRHPQALIAAGRDPRMSGNCELGRDLLRREKNATAGGYTAFWRTASGRRETPNLAAQRQSVSRKTIAELPLAGLSLIGGSAASAQQQSVACRRTVDEVFSPRAPFGQGVFCGCALLLDRCAVLGMTMHHDRVVASIVPFTDRSP